MDAPERFPHPLADWKSALVADLERVALRHRWGLALMVVGWVHLAFSLVCQALYSSGDRRSSHFLPMVNKKLTPRIIPSQRQLDRLPIPPNRPEL